MEKRVAMDDEREQVIEAPEIDMGKIGEVYEYLEAEFPDYDVSDSYDYNRRGQAFRIMGKKRYSLVTVQKEFFDAHAGPDIAHALERLGLLEILRSNLTAHVLVTPSGLRTEPRQA